MSLSVKGFLTRKYKERDFKNLFENPDGSFLSPEAAKVYLLDELSKGHLYLPIGNCDNFEYKSGCMGHTIEEKKHEC